MLHRGAIGTSTNALMKLESETGTILVGTYLTILLEQ